MSRRKPVQLTPGTVLLSICLCAAVCLAGVGYVWAKTQNWTVSREIKRLETRRDEVRRINDSLQRTYAAMCTPRELELRLKRLNLGLSAPLPDQIVRLAEPIPLAKRNAESKVYAAGGAD